MTSRGATVLALSLGALYTGLSLGGRMFYLVAVFAMLTLAFALASVLLTHLRMRVHFSLSQEKVRRGETAQLVIDIGRRGLLPVAPFELVLHLGAQSDTRAYFPRAHGKIQARVPVPAPHVGVVQAGVAEYRFSDIFGLFRLRGRPEDALCPLMVLPRDFEVEPLRFQLADDGRALPNRQSEDLSSPEDTRAYRAGDALKRIHWKLSSRKRELIVRRFETPAPPDTLILLDCTAPGAQEQTPEKRAALRDALCETALSVAALQSASDCPVRVPLYGQQADEFTSDRAGRTELLAQMLAAQPFSGGVSFERVLQLELRRMRRTGATAIITSRLNAEIAEGVKSIRRMGPAARVYLITDTPDAPGDRPYVAQLQQCMVEVCYVTPA